METTRPRWTLPLLQCFLLVAVVFASIAAERAALDYSEVSFTTESPAPNSVNGEWREKTMWKARWVREWHQKMIWVPHWKKVWGPVHIKEWIPIPKPPPQIPWNTGNPAEEPKDGQTTQLKAVSPQFSEKRTTLKVVGPQFQEKRQQPRSFRS